MATSGFTQSKLGSKLITEKSKQMEQDEEFGNYYNNPNHCPSRVVVRGAYGLCMCIEGLPTGFADESNVDIKE